MKTNLLRTSLAVLLAASALGRLSAQTPASTPASEEVLELERFKVTSGVSVEQLVLPIARPFNSVFGTDDKPGLPIIHVERDSIADQAGLESNDRVLKERTQGDLKNLADLAALSDKREVVLQVLKDGRAVWIRLRR